MSNTDLGSLGMGVGGVGSYSLVPTSRREIIKDCLTRLADRRQFNVARFKEELVIIGEGHEINHVLLLANNKCTIDVIILSSHYRCLCIERKNQQKNESRWRDLAFCHAFVKRLVLSRCMQ